MSRQPRASGHFRTEYAQDLKLIQTPLERLALAAVLALMSFAIHDQIAAVVFVGLLGAAAFAPGLVGYGLAAGLSRVLFASKRSRLAAAAIAEPGFTMRLGGPATTRRSRPDRPAA